MKPAECGNCATRDMSCWGMWGDVPVCHHCSISPMKIAHAAIERAEKAEAALAEALRERDEALALEEKMQAILGATHIELQMAMKERDDARSEAVEAISCGGGEWAASVGSRMLWGGEWVDWNGEIWDRFPSKDEALAAGRAVPWWTANA